MKLAGERSQKEVSELLLALPITWVALAYLFLLGSAEALIAYGYADIGLLLHGLLLLALLAYAGLAAEEAHRPFLLALSVVPVARLAGMLLPVGHAPEVFQVALSGLPLSLATWLVIRRTRWDFSGMGLTFQGWRFQLLVAVSGFGLGYAGFLILKPELLAADLLQKSLWFLVLISLVFSGLLQELVLRGLLQSTAVLSLGRLGVIYVALVSTLIHLGSQSTWHWAFIFCVSLAFGLVAWRTGSTLGVALAHGLANATLYLVMPWLAITSPVHLTDPVPLEADRVLPGEVVCVNFDWIHTGKIYGCSDKLTTFMDGLHQILHDDRRYPSLLTSHALRRQAGPISRPLYRHKRARASFVPAECQDIYGQL
jgi:uncharacterized protein